MVANTAALAADNTCSTLDTGGYSFVHWFFLSPARKTAVMLLRLRAAVPGDVRCTWSDSTAGHNPKSAHFLGLHATGTAASPSRSQLFRNVLSDGAVSRSPPHD